MVCQMTTSMEYTKGLVARSVVISHPARPRFVSGFIPFWIDFEIEDPDGTRLTMFQLYTDPDQYVPSSGSICRIEFMREHIDGATSRGAVTPDELHNVVDVISCQDP